MDDLVERLLYGCNLQARDGKQAADEITALRARLEEAENTLGICDNQRREWETHCKAAEARLAEVEAERDQLTQINRNLCESHNTLLVDGSIWQARAERAEAALATARRDALEDAAMLIEDHFPVTQDMESTMICGALGEAAAAIRALANEVKI